MESPAPLELNRLHADFQSCVAGWCLNGLPTVESPTMKVRFGFSDPSTLDGCPFHAKIGRNADSGIPEPWVGFAYAGAKDAGRLEEWATRFPFAEAIEGLTSTGVSTPKSVTRRLA